MSPEPEGPFRRPLMGRFKRTRCKGASYSVKGGNSMYCPKCGLEQPSDSMRYCSRCGFKVNTVDEGLARRLSAILMFLVLTTCAIFGWGSFTAGPGYMQVRVIITIFAAIAFYLIFFHDLKRIFHQLFSRSIEQVKQVTSAAHESGLPPARSIPVPVSNSRRVNTAEMLQPPSVTEQTTILLDKSKR